MTCEVTIEIYGNGSVEYDGSNINHGDTINIDDGDELSLEAIPDAGDGYEFKKWVWDGDEILNEIRQDRSYNNLYPSSNTYENYSRDIDNNITIEVHFAKIINLVKVTPPNNGEIIIDGTRYSSEDYIEVEHGDSISNISYESTDDLFTLNKWKVDINVNNDNFNNTLPQVFEKTISEILSQDNDLYHDESNERASAQDIYDIDIEEGKYYYLNRLNVTEITNDAGLDIEILTDSDGKNTGVIEIVSGNPDGVTIEYKYELKNPQINNLTPYPNYISDPNYSPQDPGDPDSKMIHDDLVLSNITHHMEIKATEDIIKYTLQIFPNELNITCDQSIQSVTNNNGIEYLYGEIQKGQAINVEANDTESRKFLEWRQSCFAVHDSNGNLQSCIINGDHTDNQIQVRMDGSLQANPLFRIPPLEFTLDSNVHIHHIGYANMEPEFSKMAIAVEDYGYKFVDWIEPSRLQGQNKEVILDLKEGDSNFRANFVLRNFQLELNTNFSEINTSNISTTPDQGGNHLFGDEITLEANDHVSVNGNTYRFSHWSGDYSSNNKNITFEIGRVNSGQIYDSNGNQRTNTRIFANYRIANENQITIEYPHIDNNVISDWENVIYIFPFTENKTIDDIHGNKLNLQAGTIENTDDNIDNLYTFSHWLIEDDNISEEIENEVTEIRFNNFDGNIRCTPHFKKVQCNLQLSKEIIDDDCDDAYNNITKTYYGINAQSQNDETDFDNINKKYNYNDTISLRATREYGYMFKYWEEDGHILSESPIISFQLRSDREIKAVFERQSFLIDTQENPYYSEILFEPEHHYYVAGNINDYMYTYKYKDEINIRCILKNNASFNRWIIEKGDLYDDNKLSIINPKEEKESILTVGSDAIINLETDITELFSSLDINIQGKGYIEYSVEPIPSTNLFERYQYITAKAIPHPVYNFVRWEGYKETSSQKIEIFLDSDTELTAIFEERPYNLNIEIEGNGYVTYNEDIFTGGEFVAGDEVELIATPIIRGNRGFTFSHWEEDGDKISEDDEITITMDTDRTIRAIFMVQQHGVFEGTPTKQLRNFRYNGPIESYKFNINNKENYVDMDLAKFISKTQKDQIYGGDGEDGGLDYDEREYLFHFINEVKEKLSRVKELEKQIEFLETKIKKGGR